MAGYRKLGRATDQRRAMLRGLVTSFLKYGKIETTETRAKETRSIAEKLITLAKRGDLHARRQVLSYVQEEEVVKNLFDNVAAQYSTREGGYTRMYKNEVEKYYFSGKRLADTLISGEVGNVRVCVNSGDDWYYENLPK